MSPVVPPVPAEPAGSGAPGSAMPSAPAMAQPAPVLPSGSAVPSRSAATWPFALAASGVERCTTRRSDTGWLESAWARPDSKVLVVQDGQALVRATGTGRELAFIRPDQAPDGTRFLLGAENDDVAYFGVAGPFPEVADENVRPEGLRAAGVLLDDRDADLLTHAVALANWHARAGYCPRCGAATEPVPSGHSRRCTEEGTELFPRVEPAVIMLVTDPADRCLLARNAKWPAGRVSVLAGFVDAGESAEQAVAREVREETGVVVGTVRYAGSQPWPMPYSLMLAFRAQAVGTAIEVDAHEISEARWYSRDDLRAALADGVLRLPPSLSIARWLIETWHGGALGDDASSRHLSHGRPMIMPGLSWSCEPIAVIRGGCGAMDPD